MAEAEVVFENRINSPGSEVSRSMIGSSTFEDSIIWRAGGLRDRLKSLEDQVGSLLGVIERMMSAPAVDLDPCPGVTATTFYELASDGALRSGVEVAIESLDMVEVALLAAPTVVNASKDANTREDNPTTNYDGYLQAGYHIAGACQRGWMQFPWGTWGASPTGLWGAEPILALVRVCKNGTYDHDGLEISLRSEDPAGTDWSESTITWNNQPALEAAARELDRWTNRATDTYNWFDITSFIYRMRESRGGIWTGAPYGLVLCQADESTVHDRISYYTQAGTADQKPQVWYWTKAEKTAVLGPTLKSFKFYGNPGATYYLVHRTLDANNVPGHWSVPVTVALPSQGATPTAPSAAPTVEATNFSNVKRIILTTSVPADFAAYEVELYCSAETKYIKTTSDRLEINFNSGSTYRDYQVRYRFVTRSGVNGSWSSYTSSFRITKELKIQRADSSDGTAYVLIDSDGDTHLFHESGSSSRTYDYVESQARLLLLDVVRGVGYNNLNASCGQAANDSEQSTTSTSWVDRTTGSITLTPPGSGSAYYLLIARATLFKDSANGIKLTFKVDGTATSTEEAWSSSAVAETVTIIRRVAVTAGSSHTFKLCFCSNDGASCKIYKSVVVALHLGNY